MKIAVQCKSPLLQKSLELFLQKHLNTVNKCEILIRDEACLNEKRCFYIGTDKNADLKKPFSKSQLILALEKREKELYPQNEIVESIEENEETLDFSILENRIEFLTKEYQSNIIKAVKAFYEK